MISNPRVPSGGQWDAPQQARTPLSFSPFPPSPSGHHHHHLPSPQPTPPTIHPSLSRFGYTMLVTGLYSPSHPSSERPGGVEQDSGALRLPQDPGLESNVLGRACRGSHVEKICGQNQCIGTLMERSNRFGNFTFSSFSPGTIRRPHHWRKKQHPLNLLGKRDS